MQNTQQKLSQDAEVLIRFGQTHTYLNKAFYHVFGERLLNQGYIDANYILSAATKGTYYSQMKDSPLQRLFAKGCVPSENIEVMMEYLENILGDIEEMSRAEEEALVFWVFLPYNNGALKRRMRQEYLLEILSLILKMYSPDISEEREITVFDGIIYDKKMCFLEVVDSVEKYIRDIFLLKNTYSGNEMLFYRGHSQVNYALQPGIKRTRRWFENEDIMYQEILVRCANDFAHCQTHLDYLVEMQHYGLPTRLLDITENPLVALYFACCSNSDKLGEVIVLETDSADMKYAKSDTVALLSALPTLSRWQQQRLLELCENGLSEEDDDEYQRMAGKLASEVKSRNPAFEPKIKKCDLMKNVFVTPIRNNQRIMKQDGSFILCGLGDEYSKTAGSSGSLDSMRNRDNAGTKLVLAVKDKEKILQQLDVLSVNKATLFPEIDDVAEYIKGKFR